MNSDQKIGVSLLIGLVGFALALGFGRKTPPPVETEDAPLQSVSDAFAGEIAVLGDPFAAPAGDDPVMDDPFGVGPIESDDQTVPETAAPVFQLELDPPEPPPSMQQPDRTASEVPADPRPSATQFATERPREQQPQEERFRTYRVQPGDTLSGIAARQCGAVGRYHELYEANSDVLASPNDLRVGQELRIPERLTVAEGGRLQ